MAAKVRSSDTIAISQPTSQIEVESAKCECCTLIEECTPAYVAQVSGRYQGRWICGLCAEAIKDEICRSKRLISMEEAINRHTKFLKRRAAPPKTTTEDLFLSLRQLLRKSLDSPKASRSVPASPVGRGERDSVFSRTESCFSRIGGWGPKEEDEAFVTVENKK